MNTEEVVFIFLGDSFPKYARSSIQLALNHSEMKVHIIGNRVLEKSAAIHGSRFTSIEEFYEPKIFSDVASKATLPNEFRNEFWLKTLERFFVMYQYMESHNVSKIFHAELDQLLFGCNVLVDNLENSGKIGVFLPFHSAQRAIASVFYCNDLETLKSLIHYAQNINSFENEMILLANWAAENRNRIFALPTLALELKGDAALSSAGITCLNSQQVGGVVDAAQLGQWVGGVDPRNLSFREKPKNKFSDADTSSSLSKEQLMKLRFSIKASSELMCTSSDLGRVNVYNLHLHSKIHSWLMRSDDNLSRLINYSNLEYSVSLPSARKIQVKHLIKTTAHAIKKRSLQILNKFVTSLYFCREKL